MGNVSDDSDLADALRTHGLNLRRRRILEHVARLEFEGLSAGGKIKVLLDGVGNTLSVRIEPSLLAPDATDALGEMIVAATRAARLQRDTARRHLLIQAGLDPEGDD